MTKVFISYARDGSYGENLAAIVQMQLQHAGFEVFRDVSGLKAGDIWYHKLEAELETSNIMVLVVSEKVRTSKWVANEVSMAEEIGIPVIPVLAENIRKPLWLRHLQVLDFCDTEDWERLFDSLGEYASAELKARLTVGKTADHGTSVHEWLPAFASDYASLAALKQKTVATGVTPSILAEACQASAPVVPWASQSGNDQYGQYADLTLQNVTQRFRWIMPGTFMMGSPESEEGRIAERETQREVTLSKGFWLADTACTQEFWQAVTGNNPAHFKGDLACPVECVSWDDVQQFIKMLNQQQPTLNARLPSEAEWEYACRAGTETAFCFGGKVDLNVDKVNYSGEWGGANISGKTKPVKSYQPNAWGLYEMHGNVWEWCQDAWQEKFPATSLTDPLAESASRQASGRVVRGGSWSNHIGYCRSACRGRRTPDGRDGFLGVRLALGH